MKPKVSSVCGFLLLLLLLLSPCTFFRALRLCYILPSLTSFFWRRRFTAQKFKTASKPDRALRLLLLLLFAVVMVLLVRLSPFVKRNIY